jgi:hypothetical protein
MGKQGEAGPGQAMAMGDGMGCCPLARAGDT